jgi:hypothetical protein
MFGVEKYRFGVDTSHIASVLVRASALGVLDPLRFILRNGAVCDFLPFMVMFPVFPVNLFRTE